MKKQLIIIPVTIVTAMCMGFAFVGCGEGTNADIKSSGSGARLASEYGYDVTYFNKVAPEDGADPFDGSGNTANVEYMAYVLSEEKEWTSVSDNKAAATLNNQQTWTYVYYDDGYMLSDEKTYSTFVKDSRETMFVCGRGASEGSVREAYVRDGSKPSNGNAGFDDVTWKSDSADRMSENDYYLTYGLFSDEICLYVVNDYTVEEAGEVLDNGDGTYTQSFVLDTENSVSYYKYSMMTHGSLSSAPTFSKVEVTFTFDESFRVLEVETYDLSKIKKFGMNFENKTSSTTTYSYPGMEGYENTKLVDAALADAQNYFAAYV
ncbi:MAG: hypothetical protein LUD29_01550 [Clostridia bacterium]|nr:hypothetical protein [Clostridia bacterium]